jgi:RHS repeat-associated protein
VSLALKPRSGVTYRYNDAGQRFQKIFGSSHTEHYIMDGSLCLGIANGQGKITYWNLIAGAVAGRYEPSSRQVLYYIKDHLGSPRMGIDQNERIITASDYYPFGLRLPARTYTGTAPQVKEGFTGKETDEESKLKYFGARLSSLSIGRWLSLDPLNTSASPYHYVSNNPLTRIDPDGLKDYYIFIFPNSDNCDTDEYSYKMMVYSSSKTLNGRTHQLLAFTFTKNLTHSTLLGIQAIPNILVPLQEDMMEHLGILGQDLTMTTFGFGLDQCVKASWLNLMNHNPLTIKSTRMV